jgi:hypothetical protein
MQEKDADIPVVWTDFVGLRTHLEGVFASSTQGAMTAYQALQLQETVQAMQA